MGDYPIPALDNKTCWQVAKTPNLDFIAEKGIIGKTKTIPEGMEVGSDVAILSIFGYDPKKYYTGRGPLEAAVRKITLSEKDVAFRCNLISSDGKTLLDYSGGHITTYEAQELIKEISKKLDTDKINFFSGVGYRHILRWTDGSHKVECIPPHNIVGKPLLNNLPRGEGEKILRDLIYNSIEILDNHETNKKRRDEGKLPANMIWPWGQGKIPAFPKFTEKYKLCGSVISAVDLVRGIGYYAGLKIIEVPGITGYFDTNYDGKAEYAVASLKDKDIVFVHIEATDEAGHIGNVEEKIKAFENIDKKILGNILMSMDKFSDDFKLLFLPDHYTPITVKAHTSDIVPYLIYSTKELILSPAQIEGKGIEFSDCAVEKISLPAIEAYELLDVLIKV